jgi:hypothetical protein
LEKSGAAATGEAVPVTGEFGADEMVLITNHVIVVARNVAGKLSFSRKNSPRGDFRFARTACKV